MNIDKEKVVVTLTLRDLEELQSYEILFRNILGRINSFAYIDRVNSESTTIKIRMDKLKLFLLDFFSEECSSDEATTQFIIA